MCADADFTIILDKILHKRRGRTGKFGILVWERATGTRTEQERRRENTKIRRS